MKPKVFASQRLPKEVLDYIAASCDVRHWDSDELIPRNLLMEELADVDGFIVSGRRIHRELLASAPKLRVVSNISVGYNNFDIEAMKERGIIGTNTPDVLNDTVADLVMGMMLAVARKIPEMDRYVREGKWGYGDTLNLFGWDVHHAKLGIIGMGRIGEAVARRAKLGFEMDVSYYNRSRRPEVEQSLGIQYTDINTLLRESDFVVLMVPLTEKTEKLIGEEQLSQMKRSAFFINASRGQTVDEQALIEALQQGVIRGAALDVFEKEPVKPDNPLLTMPNVVTLPHIGSATSKTRFDMAMLAARNMVAALRGEVPPNVVKELRPDG